MISHFVFPPAAAFSWPERCCWATKLIEFHPAVTQCDSRAPVRPVWYPRWGVYILPTYNSLFRVHFCCSRLGAKLPKFQIPYASVSSKRARPPAPRVICNFFLRKVANANSSTVIQKSHSGRWKVLACEQAYRYGRTGLKIASRRQGNCSVCSGE